MMKRQSWIRSLVLGVAAAMASSVVIAAPIARGGYYEENVSLICNAVADCTVAFTAAGNNKVINIVKLSCAIVAGAKNVRSGAFGQLAGGNVGRRQFLFPEFVTKIGNQNQYLIDTPAALEFRGGERPAIRIVTASATSQSLACQIVGRIAVLEAI